ncbi:MAG: hypothetical protein LBT40_04595, partial [Deltaproteobacteria bacterium]|nr:hypothetical protein [Deltaproteobacteria bacterium]
MPLHPFPLLALAFLAVLALSCVTCGTAMASPKKPSARGRKKRGTGPKPSPGKSAARPSPYRRSSRVKDGGGGPVKEEGYGGGTLPDGGCGKPQDDGFDDWTAEARSMRRRSPVPQGWAEWLFGDMGRLLEEERLFAERKTAKGNMLESAHAWDNVRALARLLLGPGDPRVWAALSRSARSFVGFVGDMAGSGALEHPAGREKWEFFARGAASMAAGSVDALGDPGLELAAVALPAYGFPPRAAEVLEPADWPVDEPYWVRRARSWSRAVELGFARETLDMILAMAPSAAADPPPPARSLSEAIYPGTAPEAGTDPYPPAAEFRARLQAAEGPGGPGPGSREALVLRSLLGAELWDTGGRERSAEALGLLEEAYGGLDWLSGWRAPESLDARERLARRLGGMYGRGAVLPAVRPDLPETLDPGHVGRAVELFRGLERLAPGGPEGEAMRRSASMFASGLFYRDAKEEFRSMEFVTSAFEMMADMEDSEPELGPCRDCLDMAELLRRFGTAPPQLVALFFAMSADRHLRLLGGRHPETAAAIARAADLWHYGLFECRPAPHWAKALEALEGLGERYETFRAELEIRVARWDIKDDYTGIRMMVDLLLRAEGRLRGALGESSQPALECAVEAAYYMCFVDMESEAEEIFSRVAALLDGAPPRSDPDPRMPSDAAVLSAALAGKGEAMIRNGDKSGGTGMLRRSAEMAALAT